MNINQDQQQKPRRPRTAYNFFFKSERKNILLEAMKNEKNSDGGPMSPSQILNVLQADKDRPHRKLHGMVSFRDLTTKVSSKWRSLDPAVKKLFQDLSAQDKIRYRNEIQAWRELQLEQSASRTSVIETDENENGFALSAPAMTLLSAGNSVVPNYISCSSDGDEPPPVWNHLKKHAPLRRIVSDTDATTTATSSIDSVHRNPTTVIQNAEFSDTPSTPTMGTTRRINHQESNFEPVSPGKPLFPPHNNIDWLASVLETDCVSFLISLKD